jgi:hypothetical protein
MRNKMSKKRIEVLPSKAPLPDILPLPQPQRELLSHEQTTSKTLTPVCVSSPRHRPKCPPSELCCSSYPVTCSSNCSSTLVEWNRHSSTTTYDFHCVFDLDSDSNSNRSWYRRSTIACDDCDGGLVSAHPQKRSSC